jgi:WD40 repeat protein
VPDVIASGGGTTDKTIRIWNVATGEDLASTNTGSQVCNLFWNEEYNEILSTHGFSQYQVALWRASDLTPIAQFHEHKQRVLFLAHSPDGTKVVTAAPGDDIRIWKMFPSTRMTFDQTLSGLR